MYCNIDSVCMVLVKVRYLFDHHMFKLVYKRYVEPEVRQPKNLKVDLFQVLWF